MRRAIMWLLAWVAYWCGDMLSRIPAFPYSLYNRLMLWSLMVSDEYDLGLWKEIGDE